MLEVKRRSCVRKMERDRKRGRERESSGVRRKACEGKPRAPAKQVTLKTNYINNNNAWQRDSNGGEHRERERGGGVGQHRIANGQRQ